MTGGRITYEAFVEASGKIMPPWNSLSFKIQRAWEAACVAARNITDEVPAGHCLIFGVDRASGFNLEVLEGDLQAKIDDIWNNPDNYRKTGDSWDEFLKYLWVKYPDGREDRFANLVKDLD